MDEKNNQKYNSLFLESELNTLKEAIKYERSREGNFSSSAPIVAVLGKLNEIASNEEAKNKLNKSDLTLLLKVVDENIQYVRQYNYQGLSEEQANELRQEILGRLSKVRIKLRADISAYV